MSTKSGTSSGRSSSENSLNQQAQVQASSSSSSPHQQPSPAGSSSSSSAGVSEPVVAVATNATSTVVAAVASPTTSVSSSKSKSSSSSSSNEPKARLCHLKKWPHFQGYGFNLHAERSRQGQHIGKVDPNSPAESAGLREGDRIIEVNNVNISNENHQQVVKRIRSGLEYNNVTHDDEVLLLVVDRQADEWFKSQGVIVRSSNPDQVTRLATAGVNSPHDNDDNADRSDDDDNNDEHRLKGVNSNDHNNNIPGPVEIKTTGGTNSPAASSSTASSPQVADPKRVHSVSGTPSPDTKNKLSSSSNSSMNGNAVVVANLTAATSQSSQSPRSHQQTVMPKSTAVVTPNLKVNTSSPASLSHSQQPVSKPSPNNSKSSSSASSTLSTASSSVNRQGQSQDLASKTNGVPKDDVYKMSAAEFKNYLKSKGRNDPRGISIDMRRKYEIFQNM